MAVVKGSTFNSLPRALTLLLSLFEFLYLLVALATRFLLSDIVFSKIIVYEYFDLSSFCFCSVSDELCLVTF